MKKWFWIAVLVVIADQAVKRQAATLRMGVELIPGVLGFTYTQNTGMAFSMFSGRAWLLGVVSAVAILVGYLVLRAFRLGMLSRIAAMLMLGGAVGNMIDRFTLGYVVDMFELLFIRFAVFNVADVALTVGAGLMALSLLCCPEDWKDKRGGTKDAGRKNAGAMH